MIGDAPDLRVLVALLAAALCATSYCWGRAQYQLLKLKNSVDHDWLEEPGRDGATRGEGTATPSRPEAARRGS